MNLMPYDCATRRAGKCRFWCDYTTYGNMPDCYVPALINLTPYDGRKIDPDAVLVEYVHKNDRAKKMARKAELLRELETIDDELDAMAE